MQNRFDVPELVFLTCAAVSALAVILIFGFIFWTAFPVFQKEGIGFVIGSVWNYDQHEYGILLYIIGTIIVTVVTLIIAVPLGLCTAIYLAEFAPAGIGKILRPLIELLVGIPSIVYGLFGFLYSPGTSSRTRSTRLSIKRWGLFLFSGITTRLPAPVFSLPPSFLLSWFFLPSWRFPRMQ